EGLGGAAGVGRGCRVWEKKWTPLLPGLQGLRGTNKNLDRAKRKEKSPPDSMMDTAQTNGRDADFRLRKPVSLHSFYIFIQKPQRNRSSDTQKRLFA
ncbi:MAG TPA: hypothetical protein DCZ73_05090, partial [Bacteroides sp.]|nr:hypothetical protein [Bacteroides sp.]